MNKQSNLFARSINITLFSVIFFITVNPAYASDNYPYGCVIYFNGATRVYTDYLLTDGSSSRHYSLLKNYIVGNQTCNVDISYTSPYTIGGCIVDGATSGSNVTITHIYPCPLDDYIPFSLILGAIFGLYLTRRKC